MNEHVSKIRQRFGQIFPSKGDITVASAPGRVNLIGGHTDYNGGFVMPVAMEYQVVMAGQRRDDGEVSVYAELPDEQVSFSLDKIERDPEHVWADYLKGVILMLRERGIELSGMNIYVGGNIPVGVGVSSSAALEVAAAFLFKAVCGFSMEPADMARLCQRAENEFVGMRCGLMDQYICCVARKGTALFLDCLKIEHEFVPLRSKIKLVVCNTGIRRELAGSEYNKRRKQCEEAVAILREFIPGIECLRHVSVEDFEKYKGKLSPTIQKRCEHVVYENERVLKAKDRFDDLGRLMEKSHQSLRDKYEVSCRELDLMVEIAGSVNGCMGSRMTGAGFGGCTVNLVEEESVEKFREKVKKEYSRETGIDPEIYVSGPCNGVTLA